MIAPEGMGRLGAGTVSPVPAASLPFPRGECINRATEGEQYMKSTLDKASLIFQDTKPRKREKGSLRPDPDAGSLI